MYLYGMAKRWKGDFLYADDHLLVIDKPSGYLSIPGRGGTPDVLTELRKVHPELHVVHRLDKQTSGVLVFAKDEVTHRAVSLLFQNREVSKKYFALAKGWPQQAEIRIDEPIAPDKSVAGKMIVAKNGKPSVSICRRVEQLGPYCLLEVEILTGRMHQIRVHLKHIGLPLLVDSTYGGFGHFDLSMIKKNYRSNRTGEPRPLINRVSLHSGIISFVHPATETQLTVKAELPKDMTATLKQMRNVFGGQ